jgi:tetratricopeptide (TPR) repeat protein
MKYFGRVVFVALAMTVAAGERALCSETTDAEDKALEADNHDADVRSCVVSSLNHISKQKSSETIALCSKITNDAKHSVYYRAAAYRYVGNAMSDAGNDSKAIENLAKSIELNPKDGMAFSDRADVYEKSGLTQKALDDYKRAVSLASDNLSMARVFQSMAIIYNRQEQYDLAIAYQTKAIELAPESIKSNLYKNRGTMW